MRLLLDEMYSAAFAGGLRQAGIDAVTVADFTKLAAEYAIFPRLHDACPLTCRTPVSAAGAPVLECDFGEQPAQVGVGGHERLLRIGRRAG